MVQINIVQFQRISILPPQKVFSFAPPPPQGNSSLFSYISSKNLAFKIPLPLGISNDLSWGGYGFFWNYTLKALWTDDCGPRDGDKNIVAVAVYMEECHNYAKIYFYVTSLFKKVWSPTLNSIICWSFSDILCWASLNYREIKYK